MKQQYHRHSTVSLEEGIGTLYLHAHASETLYELFNGILCKTNSLRLRTFALKGTTCVFCQMQATHFAVEKFASSREERYHLNLWAKVGDQEVLFTHDHGLARALGGADTLENAQPACAPCNSHKGSREGKIAKILKHGMVV